MGDFGKPTSGEEPKKLSAFAERLKQMAGRSEQVQIVEDETKKKNDEAKVPTNTIMSPRQKTEINKIPVQLASWDEVKVIYTSITNTAYDENKIMLYDDYMRIKMLDRAFLEDKQQKINKINHTTVLFTAKSTTAELLKARLIEEFYRIVIQHGFDSFQFELSDLIRFRDIYGINHEDLHTAIDKIEHPENYQSKTQLQSDADNAEVENSQNTFQIGFKEIIKQTGAPIIRKTHPQGNYPQPTIATNAQDVSGEPIAPKAKVFDPQSASDIKNAKSEVDRILAATQLPSSAPTGLLTDTYIGRKTTDIIEDTKGIKIADVTKQDAYDFKRQFMTSQQEEEMMSELEAEEISRNMQKQTPLFPEEIAELVQVGDFANFYLYNKDLKTASVYKEIGGNLMGSLTEIRVGNFLYKDKERQKADTEMGNARFQIVDAYVVVKEKNQFIKASTVDPRKKYIRVNLKNLLEDDAHDKGWYVIIDNDIELLREGTSVVIEVKKTGKKSQLANIKSFTTGERTKYIMANLKAKIRAGQPLPIVGYEFANVKYMHEIGNAQKQYSRNFQVVLDDDSVLIIKNIEHDALHEQFTPKDNDHYGKVAADVLETAGMYFVNTVSYAGSDYLFSNMLSHGDDYTVYAIRRNKNIVDFLEFQWNEKKSEWILYSRLAPRTNTNDSFQILYKSVDGFMNMYLSHIPMTLNKISSEHLEMTYLRPDVIAEVQRFKTSNQMNQTNEVLTLNNAGYSAFQRISSAIIKLLDSMDALIDVPVMNKGKKEYIHPMYRGPDDLYISGSIVKPKVTPGSIIRQNEQLISEFEKYCGYAEKGFIDDPSQQVYVEQFWDLYLTTILKPMGRYMASLDLKEVTSYTYERFRENHANLIKNDVKEKKDKFREIYERYYVFETKLMDGDEEKIIHFVFQYSEWDKRVQGEWITQRIVIPFDAFLYAQDENGIPQYKPMFNVFRTICESKNEEFMRKYWKILGDAGFKMTSKSKKTKIGETLDFVP